MSFRNLLKMVLHYSHSRMGGNETAHFEPGTIYIVTVGALHWARSGTDVNNHTLLRSCAIVQTLTHTDTRTHTHTLGRI